MGLNLSKRELEVAAHFALGESQKQIAEAMFLSVETINSHRKSIYKKANIHSATELVRLYISHITHLNITKIIQDNLLEMSAKKITMMLICLSLQGVAMVESLDLRRTSTVLKVKTVKGSRSGKRKGEDYIM